MRQAKSELVKLAAELLRGNCLSLFREDWPDRLSWAEVRRRSEIEDERRKEWAIRLRKISDSLPCDPRQEG